MQEPDLCFPISMPSTMQFTVTGLSLSNFHLLKCHPFFKTQLLHKIFSNKTFSNSLTPWDPPSSELPQC